MEGWKDGMKGKKRETEEGRKEGRKEKFCCELRMWLKR
jgi:hypothetical protein